MASPNPAAVRPIDAPTVPATHARYGVLAFLCSLSFVLYVDRICISQAAPSMQESLGLSNTAMGYVFGAFTVAYGLFEIPTGRMGDRYGSRGVLLRIVLWWSAFTALTGCVWKFAWVLRTSELVLPLGADGALTLPALEVPLFNSLLLLILIRFLFGAGEAGALPNSARVLARWFPPGRRGLAQGLVTTSALLGGAVAPVIAAYLIKSVGWRLAFVIFGSLGVVWAVAFYAWFRDDPAQHPAVNEAERDLIAAGRPPEQHSGRHPPVPWRQVLTSRNVWLLGGVITCAAFASYMYFSWYPKYLQSARGVSSVLSGWLASLVLGGGAVGCTLGGYLSDWLVRRTGNRRWSRRLLGCGGLGMAAPALLGSIYCDSPVAAACLTALACLSANLQLASWWAVVTEISGKHLGVLFGLMNSMGVPGAVASQLFFGRFADWMAAQGYTGRAQWDPGFYVYACVLVVGAVGWLWIDATHSVVEAREAEPGKV